MTYIAFLRAINVGGHNVSMEKLRGLFSELGFEDVRSYIQTGNVSFESAETNRTALTKLVEEHLQKKLGFEVSTMIRTIKEFEAAITLNPFKNIASADDLRFCLLFISAPIPDLELPFKSPKDGVTIIAQTPGELFILLRQFNGRPGNSGAYVEKQFKVKATVRFFATAEKILNSMKS